MKALTSVNEQTSPHSCFALRPTLVGLVTGLLSIGIMSAAIRPAAAQENRSDKTNASKTPTVLKYGDGKADGKKSLGGSGEMIRFTMPEGVKLLRGLRIHGSRYGTRRAPKEDFEITLMSGDLEEILHTEASPYRLFKRGANKWVRVRFDKPVEVPSTFWVSLEFHAEQTKGVYVSYDTSTGGEHSRIGLPGDEELKETDFKGDWMIQALIGD